jgi:hypothetical protein
LEEPGIRGLMAKERKWKRMILVLGIVVSMGGVAYSFVPDHDEAECWRSVWMAKEAWNLTDSEVSSLQKRFEILKIEFGESAETERIRADWEFWAEARQAANVAAMSSDRSPDAARASSKAALEACWLARDNTAAVGNRENTSRRTYRPGALAVRACEEAAALSEGSWRACEYQLASFRASMLGGQEEYNFFGGCNPGGF